jgi:hypothetical protein
MHVNILNTGSNLLEEDGSRLIIRFQCRCCTEIVQFPLRS